MIFLLLLALFFAVAYMLVHVFTLPILVLVTILALLVFAGLWSASKEVRAWFGWIQPLIAIFLVMLWVIYLNLTGATWHNETLSFVSGLIFR